MGLILSMQVPFVGFQPIRTSEHMAAAGMKLFISLQFWTVHSRKNCHFQRFVAASAQLLNLKQYMLSKMETVFGHVIMGYCHWSGANEANIETLLDNGNPPLLRVQVRTTRVQAITHRDACGGGYRIQATIYVLRITTSLTFKPS
jgi:hypothetical protein